MSGSTVLVLALQILGKCQTKLGNVVNVEGHNYDTIITSVMQGILGARLISHFVAQGLFALHVADIQLYTDSS